MKRKIQGNLFVVVLVLGVIIYGGFFGQKKRKEEHSEQEVGIASQKDNASDHHYDDSDEDDDYNDYNEDYDDYDDDYDEDYDDDYDDDDDDWKDEFEDGVSDFVNGIVGAFQGNNYWTDGIELPEPIEVSAKDLEVLKETKKYTIKGIGDLSEYSESMIQKMEDGGTDSHWSAGISIGNEKDGKNILSVMTLTGYRPFLQVEAEKSATLKGQITTYTKDDDINIFLHYKDTYVLLPLNCKLDLEIPEGKTRLLIVCKDKKFQLQTEFESSDDYRVKEIDE